MQEEELIHGCVKHERTAQHALYERFYSKMMGVCIRYTKNQEEAKEIFHNGFKNVFSSMKELLMLNAKRKQNTPPVSLEEWLKRTMICAAVEHLHHNRKEYFVSSTVNVRDAEKTSSEEISDDKLMGRADRQSVLKALQQLSPLYRAVFNLHEVDGYSFEEISQLLDISEPTSKDNLSKAKFNLRRNLARMLP